MRYVSTAEDFFNAERTPSRVNERLLSYFSSIPESFWKSLGSIDFSKVHEFKPVTNGHSAKEIYEHQLFLIENFDDINFAIRADDFLSRTGHDTVLLRINESYLETAQLINEGILGSVWDFLKAIVADPDPTEMSLNVLRLILDIIGIVPFTWAGFPIDIVANAISALISYHKSDWFSMVLSIMQTIDISHASAIFKVTLKPVLPFLEKIFPLIFRGGADALALEKGVAALKEGVIKIGDKSLLDNVGNLFTNLSKFITGTLIKIVHLFTGFIDTVKGLLPELVAKKIPNLTKAFDTMVVHLSTIGKDFETATKLLKADVKTTGEVVAANGQKFAADSAQGKVIVSANAAARKESIAYLKDIEKQLTSNPDLMAVLNKLSPEMKDTFIAARVENKLLGEPVELFKKAMADPALASHLAQKYGWSPAGTQLVDLAKSGDKQAVSDFFNTFVKDAKVNKALSKAEIRAFQPFVKSPEAFIAGIKNFDDTIKVIELIAKSSNKVIAKRVVKLKQLINLMARLLWQKYGGLECIMKVGAHKANDLILNNTTKLLTQEATPEPTNESDRSVDQIANGQPLTEPLTVEQEQMLQKTISDSKALWDKIKAESKNDCTKGAAAVEATIGVQMVKPPVTTANLGLQASTASNYSNDANADSARKISQEETTNYSKGILQKAGLPDDIEVQHALDFNDPKDALYFADVYNAKNGLIELNTNENSRLDETLDLLIKEGKIKAEEREAVKQAVLDDMEKDKAPDFKSQSAETSPQNEGFLNIKPFSFL
jgi:hypothetical protein